MPIYEYLCGSCRRKTEAIQRVGEKPLKICPHCGGKLTKAISAPAIQFKGSGWYITDCARAKGVEKSDSSGEKGEKSEKGEKAEKAEKKDSGEKADKKPAKSKTKAPG